MDKTGLATLASEKNRREVIRNQKRSFPGPLEEHSVTVLIAISTGFSYVVFGNTQGLQELIKVGSLGSDFL